MISQNEGNDSTLILLVDDVPQNVQVIYKILSAYGYNFAIATNGEETLKLLEKEEPDLILLDIMLPDIDGFEICRRIKADSKTADIPVIFLTAKIELEDKIRGFKLGAVDYITKPFEEEEVVARVQTHLKLRKTEKKLRQLNSAKDKFFSIISHDLKNTFTILLGYSDVLEEDFHIISDSEKQDYISAISSTTKGVYALLENLLSWSRMETGRMEYQPQNFPVYTSVNETVDLLKSSSNEKEINLVNRVSPETEVYADKNMIDTVIRNLISNAVKFTTRGGTVTIDAEPGEEGFVTISVTDTGVGMSDEIKNSLFNMEKNISKPGTEKEQGTGLGLLLCKELVEKNTGSIFCSSEIDKGSKFSFTVPSRKK